MTERESTRSSQPPERTFFSVWGLPIGVAAAIILLSSTPGSAFPEHPDLLNPVFHYLEFTALGFALTRAMALTPALTGGRWALTAWSILFCVLFALADELHQFLVPQRVFDVMDLFFDSLGAMTGTFLYVLTRAFWPLEQALEKEKPGD
ncbi:MAG: VanZ family protein [bacterium]|nr:MAG: VanZ family protein [bacterium]